MRAIAVDDERYMLETLQEAVRESPDIEWVETFSSCSTALAYATEHPVDVAFLDINMRGIGGLGLAEKLMELPPNKIKAYILLVAHGVSVDHLRKNYRNPEISTDNNILISMINRHKDQKNKKITGFTHIIRGSRMAPTLWAALSRFYMSIW